MNVGILGGGRWGRALATLAAAAGNRPSIGYRGRPPGGFPGSPNLAAVAKESDLVLIAVHSTEVRDVVRSAKLQPSDHVVIASRGIEPQSICWLSDIVTEESAALRVGAMAGPAMADEVLSQRPTAMVVASHFHEVTKRTQRALHSRQCRMYASEDLRGVELASAMVNVLTIALGLADALHQGVGVRGVIVTRGLAEATRLGRRCGADPQTFAGLAGVGDVIACGSLQNHPGYSAGRALGAGQSIADSRIEEIAALLKLAEKEGAELPLTEALASIARGTLKPRIAMDMLMRRGPTAERP
jgi:glycerol-3-phosphate dehydrogenase (NAD(P)+)